ncbi:MAG: SDR family oxidoreductase [Hyphomicrobium sp.]|nr:SDR family oxidoreductase [Hyphomicrobium sp.]
MSTLLCIGLGYTARVFAARVAAQGWRVIGTAQTPGGAAAIAALGYEAIAFDGTAASDELRTALASATHLLVSAPPDASGDPLLRHHAGDLPSARSWVGYLSTVGVYGDHGGAWVDETTEPKPTSNRSRWRLAAERSWLDLAQSKGLRVEIFRLAGIYGPGRGPLEAVRKGTARAIVKPGQIFNRIHVEDIANVLAAAIARPSGHAIYNVSDDEPAPPQDVLAYAATLLGLPPPPTVEFATADLTPMARSFYSECKRVSNARVKDALGIALAYPTYRDGFARDAALIGT